MIRILLIVVGSILCCGMSSKNIDKPEHTIMGVPGAWGEIVPHLQNNYYGSLLIHSAFDSLLGADKSGATIPSAAKDWKISEDYKTLTFYIDTSKKYSDGTNLKASDFKKAWEFGLRTNPNAYNSNVGDVFYQVEGIEGLGKKGHVSGFVAESDDVLIIKFKNPFRKAVDELKGARFAVFKENNGQFIGTGKYKVQKNSKEELYLAPNPHHSGAKDRNPVLVKLVSYDDALKFIESGTINFYYSGGLNPRIGYRPDHQYIKSIYGQESVHNTSVLNGMKGRFFQDKNMRLAFQSLVYEVVKDRKVKLKEELGVTPSFQVYLSYQYGWLPDKQVDDLMTKGRAYYDEFRKKNSKSPLVYYYDSDWSWIKDELTKKGVQFSPQSKDMVKDKVDKLVTYYKTYEPDVMTLKASFASGDPDGLYHLLGKNGAIGSPMSYRERVSLGLEKGRKLFNPDQLNEAYTDVSELILEEVPFVHIGFMPSLCLYDSRKLNPIFEIIDRNENFIDGFRFK